MGNRKFIGFPAGLLTASPLRTEVIGESDDWIALNKPTGIAIRQHPWNPGTTHLDAALNEQLKARKPELLESGATLFGSVYNIEPEISGIALFAKNKGSIDRLRNLVGSERCSFTFLFVTKSNLAKDVDGLIADAPLLAHNTKPKMIPSTAKGKKAQTHFQRIDKSSLGWSLWRASTSFLRIHQIRAHAAVEKIPILGDVLYSGPEIPLLSDFVTKKKSAELRRPIFDGIPLHLSQVLLAATAGNSEVIHLNAKFPKKFRLLLERLKLIYSDESKT